MNTSNLILAIIIIVGITIWLVSKYYKKRSTNTQQNSQSEKLFLEMLENLRREIHDSSNKTRQDVLDYSNKNRLEMHQQLEKVNDQLSKNLIENGKTIQNQFKQSADIIKDVTSKLTKLDETNKQVVGFAEQMKSLEGILKNPKQRGLLGEYFLETLLANVLPPSQYKVQYSFKNGEIVDAVVFFKEQIIPIDSKFSLEKYNKLMEEQDETKRNILEKEFKNDVKKRIDETSKYIRPHENTTDFAFMFIPAEGIYYNLLIYKQGTIDVNSQDLIEYGFKKHVIIVSPTSFYAYLQTVIQGLRASEMENNLHDIIKRVGDLGRHLGTYQNFMQKVGTHLGTTVNMYNQASKEFTKIDKDVIKLTEGESKIGAQLEILEKPQSDL